MDKTILKIEVKVSDDKKHVELVNPSTSEPICLPVIMGLIKACQILLTTGTRNIKINNATMKNSDYIRLVAQIAVLKEIAIEYSGKTIDNIISQLEARKVEAENSSK